MDLMRRKFLSPNRALGIVIFTGLQVIASGAYGLPDPSKGNPLSGHGIAVDLNGASVMRDHATGNTLYVTPPARRTEVGTFSQTEGVIDCNEIRNMRHAIYRFPDSDEGIREAAKLGQAYSPAFDASMGVYLRRDRVLGKIVDAKLKAEELKETHKEEYGAYIASKEAKESLETYMLKLESEKTTLRDDFSESINLLPPGDGREAAIDALRVQYQADLKKLVAETRKARRDYLTAVTSYQSALKEWAPYRDKLDDLERFESSISSSFAALQVLANESFERSKTLLEGLEGRIVGKAQVGTSLYGDEVDRLGATLAERSLDYSVSRLDVFNPRAYSAVQVSHSGADVKDAESGFVIDHRLITRSVSTGVPLGNQELKDSGFTDVVTGEPIKILAADSIQSRVFSAPVTLGAMCGRANERVVEYIHQLDGDDYRLKFSAVAVDYEPNPTLLTENVVLVYDYYVKAERVKGSCSLDVNAMDEYWRSRGVKKSWSLFKGSRRHSWDDSKREYESRMGLSCTLTKRPIYDTPEASKRANDALEKALYDDMFAMFVMQYAKEYKITSATAPADSLETNHPLENLGTAVLSLCGTNKYCQISGIVLKSLDDLGGSRASGRTSSTNSHKGKIYRNFDIDGYRIAQGETNITLKVCLDESVCS